MIDNIPRMSREHLENFAEYVIRQQETHINCAPEYFERREKAVWVKGYDALGQKLVDLLSEPQELINHLPDRQSEQLQCRICSTATADGGLIRGKLIDCSQWLFDFLLSQPLS